MSVLRSAGRAGQQRQQERLLGRPWGSWPNYEQIEQDWRELTVIAFGVNQRVDGPAWESATSR